MKRFLALILTLAAIAFCGMNPMVSDAQTSLRFPNAPGAVMVPPNYVAVTDPSVGLAVVSTADPKVRLFFALHKLDATTRLKNPGEAFVRQQAEKSSRKVFEIGDKVVMFVPGEPAAVAGEPVVNFHWHVGFGKTVVLLSAAVDRRDLDHPSVKQFLEKDLAFIIAGIRRTDA